MKGITYVMYRLGEGSEVMDMILHQMGVSSDKIGHLPWLAHFELSAHRQERNNMHIVTSDLANVNVPSYCGLCIVTDDRLQHFSHFKNELGA